MNGKHLLIAVFATAFSGINLVASEQVTIETIIVAKAFKNIIDKDMRIFCRETNAEYCPELELLMAATDKDLERINTLKQLPREQMKSHSIIKNIIEDVVTDAKELIEAITEDSNKTE